MTDSISRQAAIGTIKNNIMPTKEGFYEPCEVFEALSEVPSAQPEIIKCPCCKHIFTVNSYHWTDNNFVKDDFKYCPNCGARMEKVEQE